MLGGTDLAAPRLDDDAAVLPRVTGLRRELGGGAAAVQPAAKGEEHVAQRGGQAVAAAGRESVRGNADRFDRDAADLPSGGVPQLGGGPGDASLLWDGI